MIYREQGMSHALLTADLTTVQSSLVGAWTLIFGIESKFVRYYFSSLVQEKSHISTRENSDREVPVLHKGRVPNRDDGIRAMPRGREESHPLLLDEGPGNGAVQDDGVILSDPEGGRSGW